MTVSTIAEVLGGKKTLQIRVATEPDLRELTRKGLPFGTIARMAKELRVSDAEMARLAGISSRTFSRRRALSSRLSLSESDRLVQIAKVLAYARDVLGSTEAAIGWVRHENRALGGEIPLHLMDTSTGVEEVTTILGRIEHGIFS